MDLTSVNYLAPVFAQYPIEVTSAQGVWLTTRDGRRILDLYGGHAVAALGYGHPGWTAALTSQAASCNFQSNAVPMAVRARAAARLVHRGDTIIVISYGQYDQAELSHYEPRVVHVQAPGNRIITIDDEVATLLA